MLPSSLLLKKEVYFFRFPTARKTFMELTSQVHLCSCCMLAAASLLCDMSIRHCLILPAYAYTHSMSKVLTSLGCCLWVPMLTFVPVLS